jgi:TetR/AcrR family transcriptional regulator, cholesterol catabolism regulator
MYTTSGPGAAADVGRQARRRSERVSGAGPTDSNKRDNDGQGRVRDRASATRRRDEIVRVASEVFARKGVGNTTMRDIAAEAGILAGSLYHHFDSKDALLEEILRGALLELTQAYERVCRDIEDPARALERLLWVGLRFVTNHHEVTSIVQNDYTYLHDADTFAFIDEMAELHWQSWRLVLEKGVHVGVLRADLDLEVAYRSMMASIVSEVRWRRTAARPSAATLAIKYSDLYLGGLVTDS